MLNWMKLGILNAGITDAVAVIFLEMAKLMAGTDKNAMNLDSDPFACDLEDEAIIEKD